VADTPHFAFPMRRAPNGSVAVVEQETVDEIEACVLAILHTRAGELDDQPDFGISEYTFTQQPISREQVAEEVLRTEERASLLVEEEPDRFDALVDHLTITIAHGAA
jgi:phage baseplate assembly protein W